jgi:hypothetical protein
MLNKPEVKRLKLTELFSKYKIRGVQYGVSRSDIVQRLGGGMPY